MLLITSDQKPTSPLFRSGSRHIDIWFAWKNLNVSMHHLLEHINQDKKRRLSKDKDSTVNKTEYQSKRNHPKPKHQAPTISSIDKSFSWNRHRV